MDGHSEVMLHETSGDPPVATSPIGAKPGGMASASSPPPSFGERLTALLRKDFFVGGVSPTYFVSRAVFLRLLGVIHLIAFASFWSQIDGLIGSNGVAPAALFLKMVQNRVPGMNRLWLLPTIGWVNASDAALHLICAAGVLLACLLVIGLAPSLCLAGLYVLYLSLLSITPDFLSFQWDSLLLETTFLAIWFAPWTLRPGIHREEVHSRVMLVMLRWLLFRLMFSSGVVKLDDPNWRNLTALTYHYETQPLPTVFGWFAAHLPVWFHMASAAGMFSIELFVPFLLLAPRRYRAVACGLMVFLQLLIMTTGNYTFFNLLAMTLCVLLLDDRHWKAVLPQRFWEWLEVPTHRRPLRLPRKLVIMAIALVLVVVTGSQMTMLLPPHLLPPDLVFKLDRAVDPFEITNRYGLFAHMTTTRPEIIIEGSNDGETWSAYELRWKPGDVYRRPGWVQPHQPRLDWQMWFAALNPRPPAWFRNLIYRLLQGKPEVTELLGFNPFPGHPPKYIRALLYEYRFTDMQTWRKTGAWWQRQLIGEYLPSMSLPPSARD